MSDRIEKIIELNAPVERVWKAITDHREFGEWFRVQLDGPFVPGESILGPHHLPRLSSTSAGRRPSSAWTSQNSFPSPGSPTPSIPMSTTPVSRRPSSSSGLEPTAIGIAPDGHGVRLRRMSPPHRRAEAFRMNDGGWAEQVRNIKDYVDTLTSQLHRENAAMLFAALGDPTRLFTADHPQRRARTLDCGPFRRHRPDPSRR